MTRSVVVTGCSSGIGQAIVQSLAGAGFHVYGSVRKIKDAQPLIDTLGEKFTPLVFDISDPSAVASAARQVRERLSGRRLAGLVNNAGVALGGPLLHQPLDEFRRQMEINVTGQFIVTQAFAPLLGSEPGLSGSPGRIVMMSSDSGKVGAPFVGAYCASKHALEGLSESLRRELLPFGIDVIIVGPGFVATPIWDKAQEADYSAYEATAYAPALKVFSDYMQKNGRAGYPPERVASVVLTALTHKAPKVRYPVVKGWLENWALPLLLPRRWVDRIIARELSLTAS